MKYMHIRQPSESGWDPKGGITIAYILEPKSRSALCGVAFCSPQERYCKKTGRSIARGRLNSQPLKITMDGVMTCFTIAQVIRTFLVEWKFKSIAEKWPNSKWNKCSVDGFEKAGPPNSHRFTCEWEATLLGPDGTTALLSIDGTDQSTCGWINLFPRWARKAGWTWI